ncbi:uncharacterized protein N7459_005537 [Penicillium hispanicum]|uniref:uncharacterized protein n=1 Tax=Penicillium hispanicum TaxID=1080232 RepID=UPI00254251FB|nr:uncharacterized protein N7459_005537 [Penicillium hispanicum]KAJ5579552.1 hypothetical protein N7459_005537 [Penicillium hispanicum]
MSHGPSTSSENRLKIEKRTAHLYPDGSSPGFIVPGHPYFKISMAGVAHTHSVGFIKKGLGGPYFDLEKIWDEHTYYEFGDRAICENIFTARGRYQMSNTRCYLKISVDWRHWPSYLNDVISNNPDDIALEPISRTIGTDRIMDESIVCLAHVKHIDWPWILYPSVHCQTAAAHGLPGFRIPRIPPTGEPLRTSLTSVINIHGGRLYHEHIAWYHATVLVQLSLLPECPTFPYALIDSTIPGSGRRFEYRVASAGAESAYHLNSPILESTVVLILIIFVMCCTY